MLPVSKTFLEYGSSSLKFIAPKTVERSSTYRSYSDFIYFLGLEIVWAKREREREWDKSLIQMQNIRERSKIWFDFIFLSQPFVARVLFCSEKDKNEREKRELGKRTQYVVITD